MKTAFTPLPAHTGLLYDYSKNKFPTLVWGFNLTPNGDVYRHVSPACERGTLYIYFNTPGYIYHVDGRAFLMRADTYCCIPGTDLDYLQGGYGFIIERTGHIGMFMVGGPVERFGRLRYIDGCTDSLLIPPVRMGDPCFNALFFPPCIDQTPHTHPSMRVGMVIRGEGICKADGKEIPLVPGLIFIIHEEGIHSFATVGTPGMVVVAWHPDTDFGPQDENHPMINRTVVNGIPASKLTEIQTKDLPQ